MLLAFSLFPRAWILDRWRPGGYRVRVCSLLEVVDVLLPQASAAIPAASIGNVCQRWPRTFPPTSGLKIPAFFHRHFASLAVKKQRSTGPVPKGDGTILLFVASVHIYGSSSFFFSRWRCVLSFCDHYSETFSNLLLIRT